MLDLRYWVVLVVILVPYGCCLLALIPYAKAAPLLVFVALILLTMAALFLGSQLQKRFHLD